MSSGDPREPEEDLVLRLVRSQFVFWLMVAAAAVMIVTDVLRLAGLVNTVDGPP